VSEVWVNQYDRLGLVRINGSTTEWVIEALEPLLPKATPSPKCIRGHDWTEPRMPLSSLTTVRACKRCARRGLLILESRAEA
jgi:hypothetical protein